MRAGAFPPLLGSLWRVSLLFRVTVRVKFIWLGDRRLGLGSDIRNKTA